MISEKSIFFQDHMSENICFGCGTNPAGLNIKSSWEGDRAICRWTPEPHHQGWPGLLNGGIIATLIDCHCMCTAMAAAYQAEGRDLDSAPTYRYATGSMNLKYLKPTNSEKELMLIAEVQEIKNKKM